MSGPMPLPIFDMREFARRIVMVGIEAAQDLTDKKERIMLAYEHGHLSAEEAEDWIVLGGMVEA